MADIDSLLICLCISMSKRDLLYDGADGAAEAEAAGALSATGGTS